MEKYNQLTPEIIAQIQAVSDHVLTGDDINADFARDEMPIYGTHMPDLVVQPTSTEEVAAVMKICYENTIPVTPRGAGTGLAGMSAILRCSCLSAGFKFRHHHGQHTASTSGGSSTHSFYHRFIMSSLYGCVAWMSINAIQLRILNFLHNMWCCKMSAIGNRCP